MPVCLFWQLPPGFFTLSHRSVPPNSPKHPEVIEEAYFFPPEMLSASPQEILIYLRFLGSNRAARTAQAWTGNRNVLPAIALQVLPLGCPVGKKTAILATLLQGVGSLLCRVLGRPRQDPSKRRPRQRRWRPGSWVGGNGPAIPTCPSAGSNPEFSLGRSRRRAYFSVFSWRAET